MRPYNFLKLHLFDLLIHGIDYSTVYVNVYPTQLSDEACITRKRSVHPLHAMAKLCLVQLRITAASPGKVSFELPIEKHHTNRLSILHGGTIASMVDLGGSLVLASRGLYSTGVSTDLNVTYLNSGGKVGDTIRGEAVCDKCK